MAKGDHQRVQNTIDYATSQAQQPLNETRLRNTQRGQDIWNNYQNTANQSLQDYKSFMGNYQNFLNPSAGVNMQRGDTSSFGDLTNPQNWMNLVGNQANLANWVRASYPGLSDEGVNYYVQHIQEKPGANPTEQAGSAAYWQGRMPEWLQQHGGGGDPFYGGMTNALSGYQNFADTGGFSPQDIQNIRARMIAPIRGIYSDANRAVDRQRRLQHGYSPNYTAAKAKMAREQSYALSDKTTDVEAAIAQMLQQGKLAGLGGLSQVGEAGRGQQLGALSGMTNLYGTAPGLPQMFGNQVLESGRQDLAGQGLQQEIMKALISGRLGEAGVTGDFQSGMGNLASLANVISAFTQAGSGFKNPFKRVGYGDNDPGW